MPPLCPAEARRAARYRLPDQTFSCSSYGSEAYFCLVEPTKEFGMHDYHLDEREQPERRPDAVKRLAF
jgi:hypothetical protein